MPAVGRPSVPAGIRKSMAAITALSAGKPRRARSVLDGDLRHAYDLGVKKAIASVREFFLRRYKYSRAERSSVDTTAIG